MTIPLSTSTDPSGQNPTSSEYRICSRCVMDTSDPEISFDEEGVCNHCRTYEKLAPFYLKHDDASKKELEALVTRIKRAGRKKDYDCILGVSGGADSAFAAFLTKELGLRPLAVHFDNGWNSEVSVGNIEKVLKALDIDLLTYVVDWEEFKDLQKSLFRASVANVESVTDHAILAFLYQTAIKEKTKFVIVGSNFETEAILPGAWEHDQLDFKQIESIHRKFGSRPIKKLPRMGLAQLIFYRFFVGIKIVRIINYFPYNKNEVTQRIQKQLGWKPYGDKHFESVFTRFFQAYYLPRKFGFDKRRPHFSSLICSGQLTREKALQIMKEPHQSQQELETEREYVVKKLGFTNAEFEKIMTDPPKSFREYPTSSFLLPFLKKVNSVVRSARIHFAKGSNL